MPEIVASSNCEEGGEEEDVKVSQVSRKALAICRLESCLIILMANTPPMGEEEVEAPPSLHFAACL